MSQVFSLATLMATVVGHLVLLMVPRRETGPSPHRLVALGSLILSGVALLYTDLPVVEQGDPWGAGWARRFQVGFTVLLALHNVSLWGRSDAAETVLAWVTPFVGLPALVLAPMSLVPAGASAPPTIFVAAGFVIGAVTLGSSVIGMVLGHWYMILPGLSWTSFSRIARLLRGAATLRLLLTLGSLVWLHAWGDPGSRVLLYGGYALFFWLRILVGSVFSTVLAWMIADCVKLRANMSATGLLYIVMMTLTAGEMLAIFLLFSTGVPL